MKSRAYQFSLLASVTLSGAAVLIIEVTATRILTPYFGNSIFTFSSVISTILAALGLGYYLGGRLADRRPRDSLFYALIALAGFAVLLLQALSYSLLPRLALSLSMVDGPLIVSLCLFLFPALFLGMLSPFAIKLLYRTRGENEVGTAAGLVFFWSTLGSIGGSLSAGFWLIPHFAVSHIVITVGCVLLTLGGIGLLLSLRRARALIAVAIACGLAIGLLLPRLQPAEAEDVVFSVDGLYEKIVVREIPYQGRKARILLQDRNINSGMFIDDGRMAFDYTRYFELYRLFTPQLNSVLAIGGGAYSVPGAILRDVPGAKVDVAEIEPRLLSVARRYFRLPKDSRLSNHVVDGRRYLNDTVHRYDLIFLDVYRSFASVPMQFTTREFFQLARERLQGEGVFIANYYASLAADTAPVLDSIYKTMQTVFPQVYLFATVDPASEQLQNFIFVGHNPLQADRRIDLGAAAELPFDYDGLKRIAAQEIRPSAQKLASALLLTDDYAPVEYYAAKLLRRHDAQIRASR